MTAKNVDLELWSGDPRILRVTVSSSDGSVVNMTSSTVRYRIQPSTRIITPAISKTTGGGGIQVTSATIFEVTLAAADTALLDGTYYHEADVDGATVLCGTVTIHPTALD